MKDMIHMTHIRKTVLITGAFGGIGEAVSSACSLQGNLVIRVSRRLPVTRETAPGWADSGVDIEADLASATGWERVVERVRDQGRRIDTLVHCAGNLLECDISSVGEADLRRMLDDNILSTILACRTILPEMRGARNGSIIILGSLGGIVPMPHESVYSAAKFAVRGFTLSLAEELRGSGVTVSLISCGSVRSLMLSRESRHSGSISFFTAPLRPEKVAETVLAVMDHPRRETVIPKLSGAISPVVGAFPWLFRRVYPVVSAVGRRRKIKFATGVHSGQPEFSRRQR
jgi:short-subunit dehydrogenase